MIVALARKLLIALWRMVKTGELRRACVSDRRPRQLPHSREQDRRRIPSGPVTESEVAGARYMTCSNTAFQMGTAARSLVADAVDCIMVRASHGPTEYKVAAHLVRPANRLRL